MSSFTLDLNKFINKTSKTADAEVRKICLDLLTGIVLKTPVDTGRARANWFTSIGSPSAKVTVSTDPSGSSTISGGLSAISKATGNVLWITNNLPYIYRLEFEGWSKQAPAGMVRVTINDIKRQLR
jgi:hypothetical protein